jgi:hypothetical protein
MCGTVGREESSMQGKGWIPEGNWPLVGRKVRTIIIQLVLQKENWRPWTGFRCLRLGILAGCYEQIRRNFLLRNILGARCAREELAGFRGLHPMKTSNAASTIFRAYSVGEARICTDYLWKDTDREKQNY